MFQLAQILQHLKYQAIWYDVAIILYSKYLALERLLIAYTDCLVHMTRRKI